METLTKITELLKAKGLQQKDLTSFLGVKNSAYTDWKAGKSKSYIKYLYQIAKFLDTTPEYLKGESKKIDIKEKTPMPTGVSESDLELLAAYHSKPEMHEAIKKLLGISDKKEKTATFPVRVAARSGKDYSIDGDEDIETTVL